MWEKQVVLFSVDCNSIQNHYPWWWIKEKGQLSLKNIVSLHNLCLSKMSQNAEEVFFPNAIN